MDSSSIKLFGTEEPVPEARLLTAGPVTVELDEGNLRYIRYQGHEALRAVSFLVRDEIWGTYTPALEGLKVEQTADGFSVSYQAVCSAGAQEFTTMPGSAVPLTARSTSKATATPIPTSSPIAPVSSCCIRCRAWAANLSRWSTSTVATSRPDFPSRSIRCSRSWTSVR